MKFVIITNLSNNLAIPLRLGICESFFSRFNGLMNAKTISNDGGLFFVNSTEDVLNAAIHMFFMNFDISIFWVDANGRIVDKILARKWKTIAAPSKAAKYILETHVDRFQEYNIGDFLELNYG
jgi:uncharacterized membrane protein (UPF0127 family)